MGYGSYSTASYSASTGAKIAAGTTFAYDRTVRSTGDYKAHKLLDPKTKNKDGVLIRESRDSVEHPNSTPIAIGLDVTGSMANTPRIVQTGLNKLFGLLLRRGYCEDPQVMFTAYGDAFTDNVPLQAGQFESSDKAIGEVLDSLFCEGNGGGNNGETSTLLWHFMNEHTVTDSWEKRGKKGYFFMIADEKALDLRPEHVKKFIGDDETPSAENLTAEALAEKLKEKWEVFVLVIDNGAAFRQDSKNFYSKLFGGNHIIMVQDDTTIPETIGAVIGRMENDDLDDDDLIDDLKDSGVSSDVATRTAKAVAKVGGNVIGSVAKTGMKMAEDTGGVQFL